ncbi:hypothetical protein [Prescottella agglutinans]|uniref:Uncharacterized protein n=1 Tax=Prescottella agglutinans TaxID=1644129 RepID=A0ABT6MIE4_9NOCA|nr:hypothetical protein [Prescottella agglutinans]MDH6284101.1 hypothetical protein [Prescottella agglutinans]
MSDQFTVVTPRPGLVFRRFDIAQMPPPKRLGMNGQHSYPSLLESRLQGGTCEWASGHDGQYG